MTENNESFGPEGSGSIIVTPGFEFRPFHSAYQYVPTDQERALDTQIQHDQQELRRKLNELFSDEPDPEGLMSRKLQASNEDLPFHFPIVKLTLHDFGTIPSFGLRIQAAELGSRITK